MLLRPCGPSSCPRLIQSCSTHIFPRFISSISIYLPSRTYTISKFRPASQRPKPASVAINPPRTTRPPLLDLPNERSPHLPRYRYYFRVGKAYGIFYKNGLKAIWTNYKLARALPNHIFSSSQARIHQAVRDGVLSRADFQLIRRTRRDINKVPLFVVLWLICGEFTPLVITVITGAVPRTVWIPKQVQKARKGAEDRRAKSQGASVVLLAGPLRRSDIESMPRGPRYKVLKSCAQTLGLYPAWWDRWTPSLIPTTLLRRRVYSKLAELDVDDFAIERDGGVATMDEEEVRIACEEVNHLFNPIISFTSMFWGSQTFVRLL